VTVETGTRPPEVELVLSEPLKPQLAELQRTFAIGTEVVAVLAGTPHRFQCRVHSSDIPVIFDTFVGLYHLPPVHLPPSPVIVDLGANIGCTMVHYASLYTGARIVGVELDAENVRLAKINTAAMSERITLLHAAIAPTDGLARYSGQEAWGYRVDDRGDRTAVALSMSSLLGRSGISTVDFLKVDIEGGERELFEGPLPWMSAVNSLAVEVHDDERFLERLIDLLTTHGLQAARDPHHWSAVIAGRAVQSPRPDSGPTA